MRNLFNYLKAVFSTEAREEERNSIRNLLMYPLAIIFIALAFGTKTGRFILNVIYGLGGLFVAVYFAYRTYRNCRMVIENFATYRKENEELAIEVGLGEAEDSDGDEYEIEAVETEQEDGEASEAVQGAIETTETEQEEAKVSETGQSEIEITEAEESKTEAAETRQSETGVTEIDEREKIVDIDDSLENADEPVESPNKWIEKTAEEKTYNAYYFDADTLIRKSGSLYIFFITGDFKTGYLLPREDDVAVTDEDVLKKILAAENDPDNKKIFLGCTNFIRTNFVVLKKKKDFNNKKLSEMLQKKVKCIM